MRRRKRVKPLTAARPNPGIQAEYRRALVRLVDEMNASVLYWLRAAYRANEPALAAVDELPAQALKRALRELQRRWQGRFDGAAQALAEHFAKAVAERSDASLRRVLREGGFTVEFRMTRAQRDVIAATVAQNVSLIRSIPQRHMADVEGAVMRSVQAGRDLGVLSGELQKSYGVTKRRAALIARDQNNKATGALVRARQLELGIGEGIWVHSHAGKQPRPTHVAMDGKRYAIEEGMWDPAEDRYVHPGELINCRCVSRPVVRGFV